MRTRVKICGVTREEDALAAVRQGADAIGLVFYPPSPRAVTVEQARGIVRALPPFVTVVGLFVDAPREEIAGVVERVRIDLLQFHGHEAPEDCANQPRPYVKAVRMRDGVDPAAEARRYPGACAVLLDTYCPGVPGGTGAAFDWGRVPAPLAAKAVLAGGLTPENVEQAIRRVRPYAVDVSGGVERARGVKDAAKIEAFMRGVRRADQ